ncbi:hypothetical protein FKV68_32940 (plasmid) [Sinorhizobium mexicanum]|uniref:Uncharacterized protein n=1 Tax=Sinorhizobium mexicanum TaxID=375549 RepID=A0A859QH23_9HYPH|nr:hypothetical protein FKV68_32940 [Sinorhizobium mexicanum]
MTPPSALPGISPTRGEIGQKQGPLADSEIANADVTQFNATCTGALNAPADSRERIGPKIAIDFRKARCADSKTYSVLCAARLPFPLWGRCPAGQRGVLPWQLRGNSVIRGPPTAIPSDHVLRKSRPSSS